MKPINSILFRSLLATLAIIGAASCSDDPIVDDGDGNDAHRILLPGEYHFIISCDTDPSFKPSSRVSYESIEASRFSTGDHIGVFASDREAQIQNDVFSARNMNDDSEIQVLAPPAGNVTQGLETEIPTEGDNINYIFYYPMNESWKLSNVNPTGTGLSYSVETDQSTKENYEKSDFLWNHLVYDGNEEYQSIHMHHLMANIVVKIHKDSIAPDPVSNEKTVTLRNLPVKAARIYLFTGTPGAMKYSVPDRDNSADIKMYCQGEMGDYLVYRAAIPAWNTLSAGDPIITVNLYDRQGNVEEVTYNLAKDISLKDGFYYTFTLRSAVKPAIPDVSEDDSWVLDVFDPETNEIVGLLCREYLRYQPGVGRVEKEYITGTPYNDTKYVLSQAWVFYNLKEDYESERIVNLDEGTVLRFIYDLRTSKGAYTNHPCESRWPLPHQGATGGGGGIFAVEHGHVWEPNWDDNLGHGESSPLYQWRNTEYVEKGHDDPLTGELYMHGGTIKWEQTTGVHPFNDNAEELYYHQISEFKMPDPSLKVTNNDAKKYGHIAIEPSGKVGVSYRNYDDQTNREIDNPDIKVGIVVPHTLNDLRGEEYTEYPIVKIGYNNFWMSKSLHTQCMNDGTPLVDHYNTLNRETVSFNDPDTPLEKGFLYPYRADEGIVFDAKIDADSRDYPLLYNYVAFSDPKFVPREADVDVQGLSRFKVNIPDDENMGAILNYFGIACAAKLMSASFRPAILTSYDQVYDLKEALKHKCYTDDGYNFYVANISGFNLLAMGGFTGNSYNKDLGRQLSMWLLLPEDERITQNAQGENVLNVGLLRFDNYSAFSDEGNLGEIVHKITQMPTGEYTYTPLTTQLFYPVRYFMRMKYQQNTSDVSRATIKSSSRSGAAQAPKRESNLVTVPVIECKE